MASGLKSRLKEGRPLFGAWLQIAGAYGAEVAGMSGFDWIGIDTQHGFIGYDTMLQMIRAASVDGTPVIVRVGANDGAQIGRALDAGADGVIVPMVETREDVQHAIEACKYAPLGVRSWGPMRAALRTKGFTPESANERVVCIPQVETVRGVDNISEIVEVAGVDIVYIGPNDLAISAGLPPDLRQSNPKHVELIDRVIKMCREKGIPVGTHVPTPDDCAEWSNRGFAFQAMYLEASEFARGLRDSLRIARGDV
ncbi:MAG: HpcH/HpaI aldolase family protein [Sciscionella sp.]